MDAKLIKGLEKLNSWLKANKREVEIVIIGAFAIELNGISLTRYTEDIDSISELDDEKVYAEIRRIGKEIGLDNWLNFQSGDIPLPKGYEARLQEYKQFSNIKAKFVSKEDLILLKCSAYHIRCEYTNKDYEDLRAIGLTAVDVEKAIKFIQESNHPPDDSKTIIAKFKKELAETKANLLKLVKNGKK